MTTQYRDEPRSLFREVKRKAAVGERIRVVNPMFAHTYGKDDVGTVISSGPPGVTARIDGKSGDSGIWHHEYVVLEPVTPAPPQQLDFLEAIALFIRENAAAVRKYLDEIEAPEAPAPARPNPLTRAEVVAKAKADVAELIHIHWGLDVRFRVNRDKRAVACDVLRDGKRCSSASAKAAPGDVFHAEIGKAIALRRALGLQVPDEYINAPKPDEPRVGMTVRVSYDMTHPIRTIERKHATIKNGWWFTNGFWASTSRFTVIDDTDVDYKEAA